MKQEAGRLHPSLKCTFLELVGLGASFFPTGSVYSVCRPVVVLQKYCWIFGLND